MDSLTTSPSESVLICASVFVCLFYTRYFLFWKEYLNPV